MRLYSGMGTGDAKTLIERAQMAESSGMDGMWAEQLNGTPFLPLAAVAGATTKLELGTSIALAFTRSPLETALTALDMDVLTNGRFNLGLGTGVQRLVELWHGVPYGKAVPHLREVVESVRLIMDKASKNEPIRYEGEYVQVNIRGWTRPMKPVREKIPVYLAGVQAGMARLAGQVADGLNGTPFLPLAAVAGATTKLELGTSIALAFTRSPLETALTALDMDVLTNGRFNLGLGTGVQRLVELWHGVPYGKAVPHLREVVESVRLIMDKASKNEPIRYEGEYVQVNIRGWTRPMKPVREKIPVYLAGVQAGMARLAGQVADGLLGHIIWSPFWIEEVILPNVAKGLERAGRERKDIELMVPLVVIISRDEKEARMDAAREVAFFSTVRTYQPLMEAHGFGKITEEIQKRFREHGHSEAIWELVTDDMIDAFTVVGNVDRVSKKMKSFEPLVDAIMVEVPGFHLDTEKNEDYRKAIFETFSR